MTVHDAASARGNTSAGPTVEAPRSSGAKRVADVMRIQSVNAQWLFAWPLGILAIVFAFSLATFAAIGGSMPPEGRITGGLMAIFFTVGGSHLQTITQMFPFAMGISVTRRAFAAGTALMIVAQATLLGLVLTLLELLERATAGWGMELAFFGAGFLRQDNPFLEWLVYTALFLVVTAGFVIIGVVFKRWGQAGVYTVSLGAGALLAGAAVLVSWLRLWPTVGAFFVDSPPLALLAAYPLVIAVVLGAISFALLRRATP